jgi:hypothetical protein
VHGLWRVKQGSFQAQPEKQAYSSERVRPGKFSPFRQRFTPTASHHRGPATSQVVCTSRWYHLGWQIGRKKIPERLQLRDAGRVGAPIEEAQKCWATTYL